MKKKIVINYLTEKIYKGKVKIAFFKRNYRITYVNIIYLYTRDETKIYIYIYIKTKIYRKQTPLHNAYAILKECFCFCFRFLRRGSYITQVIYIFFVCAD